MLMVLCGCAKDTKINKNIQNRNYVNAWIKNFHKDAIQSGNGIYILENHEGNGKKYNGERYVYISYTIKDLTGEILYSTEENIARKIGVYTPAYCYGPKINEVDKSEISAGVEDILKVMKIGGEVTALIPAWLNVYERYDKKDDYFEKNNEKNIDNLIYTIQLKDFTNDIKKWETDSLKRFVGNTSAENKAEGFYFVNKEPNKSKMNLHKDTTINVYYICRWLNGNVFTTNVEDTAKVYGIYSEKSLYSPLKVSMNSDESQITSSGKIIFLEGFKKTLWEMENSTCARGISASFINGDGNRIYSVPKFCPLIFDIRIVEKNK